MPVDSSSVAFKALTGLHLLVSYLFVALLLRGAGRYLDTALGNCAGVLVGVLFMISWYVTYEVAHAGYIGRLRRNDRLWGTNGQ